jgi:YVTN family beta-propeller protein
MLPTGLQLEIVTAVRAEAGRTRTPWRRWLAQPSFRPALAFATLLALLLALALAAVFVAGRNTIPQLSDTRIQIGDPTSPRWLASDDQSIWVHEIAGLVRVDLATSAVVGQVPMYMQYGYVATGAGAVWQTDFANDVLLRIDPVTEKVVASIPVGSGPEGVAVTAGSVWVANEHDGTVSRVDPETNLVIATISVGPAGSGGPQIMTAGPGGVWVDIQNIGSVVRVNAATNTADLLVPLEGWVASDGQEVWISVEDGPNGRSEVVRIDPVSGTQLTKVPLDSQGIGGLAVGLGSVWVAGDGLTQIDEATGRIVQHHDTQGDSGNAVVAGGSVWVTADNQPYVLRVVVH